MSIQDFGAGIIDDVLYVFAGLRPSSATEPYSDAFGIRSSVLRADINDQTIVTGNAYMVIPYFNFVRFIGDHGRGVLHCSYENGSHVPEHGTPYTASVSLEMSTGQLLHQLPSPRKISNTFWPDVVVHGSGVGVYAQDIYKRQLTDTEDRSGIKDLHTGQPYDQLPGDWGHMHATGVGIHADELMAFLRVSETAGVFCYYLDGCTRVCGEVLELESDAYTERSGSDNGELYIEREEFYTPWEQLGYVDNKSLVDNPWRRNEPARVVRDGGQIFEAAVPAESFARFKHYGGYLGQGQLQVFANLPDDASGVITESMLDGAYSLAKAFTSVSGVTVIESAKRITIAKTFPLPIPVRKYHPDSTDENADNLSNYRFSGEYGEGEEKPFADLSAESYSQEDGDYFSPTLCAQDLYVWDSMRNAYRVFQDHENDFEFSHPDTVDAQIDDSILRNEDAVVFKQDGATFHSKRVDATYRQKLRQVLSLIQLGEDGSITLQEAGGAAISLSNGIVNISGVSLRTLIAKSLYLQAANISLRGAKEIEAMASDGRVRIAASKDLMFLGGNSGTGGVYIESRGSNSDVEFNNSPDEIKSSGVIIKSGNAPVHVLSAGVYVRTGVPSGGGSGGVSNGNIVIDASAGRNDVIIRARDQVTYAQASVRQFFGTRPDSIREANLFSANYNRFSGSLGTMQQVIVGGGIQAIGNIVSTAQVGTAAEPQAINRAVESLQNNIDENNENGSTKLDTDVQQRYEITGRPGNDTTIKQISFGFRNNHASHARVYVMQPYWQTLLEKTSATLNTWQEQPVVYQPGLSNQETRVWPGQARWTDDSAWIKLEENILITPETMSIKHPQDDKATYDRLGKDPIIMTEPSRIETHLRYIE